jgi:ABC-type sugar transport system substrate-binding protein
MKKLGLSIVVLAVLLMSVSICVASTRDKAGEDEGEITVATITYTTEIEWFYILEQNYKAVAEELDAILISPVDPQVIKAACEEAMAKGIFVLIQGQERETVPWSTANFGYDEKQMGTLTGEIAAAGVKEKYPNAKEVKLAVLGDPGWASSDVRMGGAKEAFMKGLPGVKVEVVVDYVMGSTIETATNVIESSLQQHPDLRCVVGINDDAAIGSVGAMQQQGIDILEEACIAGAGNNKGTWPYIDRGEILGSVDLNHRGTAEVALNAVKDLVNGKEVPEMMYIDMIKVTKENLGNWYKK